MDAYVINLDNRPDRWEEMKRVWGGSCLNLSRFPAQPVNKCYKTGIICCFVSHQRIIRMAKEAKLPYVLIMEDDATKEGLEWDSRFLKILDYLKNHLGEWEIFLGGGMRSSTVKPWNLELGLYYSMAYMAHFALVNASAYDKLLKHNPIESCNSSKPYDFFTVNQLVQVTVHPCLSEQNPQLLSNPQDIPKYVEFFRQSRYFSDLMLHNFSLDVPQDYLNFLRPLVPRGRLLCFSYDLMGKRKPGSFFIENLACLIQRLNKGLVYLENVLVGPPDVVITEQFGIGTIRQWSLQKPLKVIILVHGSHQYQHFYKVKDEAKVYQIWCTKPGLQEELLRFDPGLNVVTLPSEMCKFLSG